MVHGLAQYHCMNVLHAILRPSTCGAVPYLAVCQNQSELTTPSSVTPLSTLVCVCAYVSMCVSVGVWIS